MIRKKMYLAAFAGLALAFVGATVVSAAEQNDGAVDARKEKFLGYWLSQEHDGIFRLEECGDRLCGRLVGLQYEGTKVPHDRNGRSECNLLMLTDFHPSQESRKRLVGKILDPDSGSVYQARIWLSAPDVLKLRGYIGLPIFGETQTWTRYQAEGKIGAECKMLPDAARTKK